MMVALLLYSYALGQRSSRAIERRCREDVPTRVICANQVPDHTTIARFRARHQEALARTFTQVLALCARAGLVSVGVVALDGTAMAANASREATRSYPAIREEVERMLGEAAAVDAAEDAEHGAARGDELPAELADRRSRLARLRRCRRRARGRAGPSARPPIEENLRWRAEWEAEHGRKLGGRKPFPPDPDGAGQALDQHDRPRLADRSSAPGKARCRATTPRPSRAPSRSSSRPTSPSNPTTPASWSR